MTAAENASREAHVVLLRREITAGVEILVVLGAVESAAAAILLDAIADAVTRGPRGVLVDLSGADSVSDDALHALRDARGRAPGWPRPALAVCCTSAEAAAALGSWVPVHPCVKDGLVHIDDRSAAPRHRMELDSSPQSPAKARAMAAQVVADLGLSDIGDDLALVVSELVTNAILYAEPPVVLEIEATEEVVTVAVADGSPGRPVAREAADDAEGGRGLALVDMLCAETGVRPHPPGKTVWAALPRP